MKKGLFLTVAGAAIFLTAAGAQSARDRSEQASPKADLSGDRALRLCRRGVEDLAAQRFGTSHIEVRNTDVRENRGGHDRVTGTFDLRGGADGQEGRYRFSCAVDLASGRLGPIQMDPVNTTRGTASAVNRSAPADRDFSPPTAGRDRSVGAADRLATPASDAMETCRRAAEDRIGRSGPGRIHFDSMRPDNRPGRSDWIQGTATQDNYGSFQFSCRVDPRTGELRALNLDRR